ncbi:MAG: hypothetical protein WD556_07400 [Actinomycetota bacterium]
MDGALLPVSLTNDGIQSTDTLLRHDETAEILRDLAEVANLLVNPAAAAEMLRDSDD